jgi:hypothetical protein
MRGNRVLLAVSPFVAFCLFDLAASASPSPPAAPASSGVIRVERHFHFDPPWEAECEAEGGVVSCGVPILFAIPVTTPGNVSRVDVVATVSLDYVTSGKSVQALPGMSMLLESRSPRSRKETLNPGQYPVTSSSPNAMTSTTLTWTKGSVAASGLTYDFELSVAVTPPPATNGVTTASGDLATLVIELWSSGP